MKECSDFGPAQAAFRLGDLYEVARRVRRLGIRDVEVDPHPDEMAVRFFDPRVRGSMRLELSMWEPGSEGWYWYADLQLPTTSMYGPLAKRRLILDCPYPRQVVRAYQRRIWYEMRPPRRKTWRR